jgi:hypothetical protein
METFLTYSDWCDQFGEKYKTPKYASRGVMGVDVDRCQKIAASKNGKIIDRNKDGYSEYLANYRANNDLSQVWGEGAFGVDLFRSLIVWISETEGKEAAENLIEKSGRFIKGEDGKWSQKDK